MSSKLGVVALAIACGWFIVAFLMFRGPASESLKQDETFSSISSRLPHPSVDFSGRGINSTASIRLHSTSSSLASGASMPCMSMRRYIGSCRCVKASRGARSGALVAHRTLSQTSTTEYLFPTSLAAAALCHLLWKMTRRILSTWSITGEVVGLNHRRTWHAVEKSGEDWNSSALSAISEWSPMLLQQAYWSLLFSAIGAPTQWGRTRFAACLFLGGKTRREKKKHHYNK